MNPRMTEAIEYERDEELYRSKGRIWLEASTDLGVSRGALAEMGVHGRIEEPPPDDAEDSDPPLDEDRILGMTFAAPPQRMPDVICRRGPARGRTLDEELLDDAPAVPLTRKEQGRQDAQKLAVLLAEGELKPDTRRAFEEMQVSLGRYPSLTDRQRAWVDSVLDEQGLDWRDPRVKNANVPRGREVPTPAVLKQLPLAPPGRKPPAFPPEHPGSKAAAAQGGDPWPWDEPGRVRGDVVPPDQGWLPLPPGHPGRIPLVAEPGQPRMWGQYSQPPQPQPDDPPQPPAPAQEPPKAAPAAPRSTSTSSPGKGARTRRRSALATDD